MVKAFIGATRALPKTKAISVELSSPLMTLPLRKATALKTSCELSLNICNSRRSTFCWKKLRGILISLSVPNSELQSRNLVTMSSGRMSSHFWPLSLHMFLSRSRAFTVYGATRPIGSSTAETRLRTILWVTVRFVSGVVPRLTTSVSEAWFYLRPSTSDDSSVVSNGLPSLVWLSEFGSICCRMLESLDMNFVSLNPSIESNFVKSLAF